MYSRNEERTLNPQQQKAVTHGAGPLMIIAGAGTGKTTVITERIKYLITKDLAKADEILALTFTEKAAMEMETRVDQIMSYGYSSMWISTFHKFCDRILRTEAIHIGLSPAYTLMTDTDATMLLRKHIFSFGLDYFRPLGNPTKFIGGMLKHFSRLKDEDVVPDAYIAWANAQQTDDKLEMKKNKELAHAYKAYEALKTQEGRMDFSDLIANTLLLFRSRPNILKEYQNKFRYFLIDEFQDTNVAQNELVLLLAQANTNITVVADDDQSIYKFRGAAVSNVLSFRKHFPKTTLVVLTKNYRSTQEILDASYRLIEHNNPDRLEVKESIDKRLVAQRNVKGVVPSLLYVDRVENEADAVAKEILARKNDGYHWGDVAVLVRANTHAEPFARAFARRGIPFQFLGPGQLFRQPEIKDLIAYLSVLDHYEDNVSMFRVLSMEYFALPARELAAVSVYAKKNAVSLFEACEVIDQLSVSDTTKETVALIVRMIHKHLALLTKETGGQLLYFFLEDSGMLKKILHHEVPFDDAKAEHIAKFFGKLKTYEIDHDDARVAVILDWVRLSMELGESPLAGDTDWSSVDAVNMLTVHSAKGLEFPIVFLVNLVAQRFPSTARSEQIPIPDALIKEDLPEGDPHIEEERRLCYVGVTRARDLLFVTAADFYGEGKREKKLSPFVHELFGASVQKIASSDAQLSLLEWKKSDELVSHPVSSYHVESLSYSQIEAFRVCPLHYKLRYMLGITTPPTPALSFGTSIHAVMREVYDRVRKGETVTENDALALLETCWIRSGYTNAIYEKEMKQRGVLYLRNYFASKFSQHVQPVVLEESFSVPIFASGKRVHIVGKIDRIDAKPDGSIEIIDYKTGKMPSQRALNENIQLSLYALAASELNGVSYQRKPEDISLTLYYFDTNETVTTKRTKEELEQDKEKIVQIAKEMETSEFACSQNMLCEFCEYHLFCGIKG